MPDLATFTKSEIAALKANSQFREPKTTEQRGGVVISRDGKEYINFSGNDYLGLSNHSSVIKASIEATEKYGSGAGASRLITGNHPLYDQLEARIAQAKGTEAACVFGSGYLANIGTIQALVGEGDVVFVDKLAHACMFDGVRMSGASMYRFKHNHLEYLEKQLTEHRPKGKNALILTETIFSMDGDRAPIAEIAKLAKKYDAWLMTDDAHGFGIIPPSTQADIQMGTLSKAIGSYGGYIAADQTTINFIKSKARSLIYTTALPPATIAASLEAIRIMQAEPVRKESTLTYAQTFTEKLGLPQAQSCIVPLIIGEEQHALAASEALSDAGFIAHAIRPPTVPPKTARLRFTFSANHTENQLQQLIKTVKSLKRENQHAA